MAARLELFRTETLASFEPVDKVKEAENVEIDNLLDSTMGLQNFVLPDLEILNTRAGLYIYLNAALVGRPLIDDRALFNYLHNRYQGDIQTTAIDLILASFDTLANAVFRNEGPNVARLLRSYLINKLPLILAALAGIACLLLGRPVLHLLGPQSHRPDRLPAPVGHVRLDPDQQHHHGERAARLLLRLLLARPDPRVERREPDRRDDVPELAVGRPLRQGKPGARVHGGPREDTVPDRRAGNYGRQCPAPSARL